jgi:hypothetical protein
MSGRKANRLPLQANLSFGCRPCSRAVGDSSSERAANDPGLQSRVVDFSFAALMTVSRLPALPAARLPGRFGHGAVLVSAAGVGDSAVLCVPTLHGSSAVRVAALLAAGFTFGAGGQLANVTVMAVRQAVTPDGMQARAAATITCVGMGPTPLGSLLGGFLAEEWVLHTGLLVTGAGMPLSPVFELFAGPRVNVRIPRRAVPARVAATTGRSVPSSPFSLFPLVPAGRWNCRHRGSWIPVFRAGFRCSASESSVGITPISLPSLANLRFLQGKSGQVKIPPDGAIGVFRTLSVGGARKSFLHIYDRKL